jgi:hypothetical protein
MKGFINWALYWNLPRQCESATYDLCCSKGTGICSLLQLRFRCVLCMGLEAHQYRRLRPQMCLEYVQNPL